MAYQTRSNTLKLQRLIEVLRERGSDLAASLETTAADFLDDVKPKSKPPAHLVAMYDSDDGSSYCEEDESWGSEWEEDLGEEEEPPPKPEVIKEPTPPPPVITKEPTPPPVIIKESTPPPVQTPVPVVAKDPSPPPKPKDPEPPKQIRPTAHLSGFESSKSVPTPLMKFSTHHVSIPSSFGSTKDKTNTKKPGDRNKHNLKVDVVQPKPEPEEFNLVKIEEPKTVIEVKLEQPEFKTPKPVTNDVPKPTIKAVEVSTKKLDDSQSPLLIKNEEKTPTKNLKMSSVTVKDIKSPTSAEKVPEKKITTESSSANSKESTTESLKAVQSETKSLSVKPKEPNIPTESPKELPSDPKSQSVKPKEPKIQPESPKTVQTETKLSPTVKQNTTTTPTTIETSKSLLKDSSQQQQHNTKKLENVSIEKEVIAKVHPKPAETVSSTIKSASALRSEASVVSKTIEVVKEVEVVSKVAQNQTIKESTSSSTMHRTESCPVVKEPPRSPKSYDNISSAPVLASKSNVFNFSKKAEISKNMEPSSPKRIEAKVDILPAKQPEIKPISSSAPSSNQPKATPIEEPKKDDKLTPIKEDPPIPTKDVLLAAVESPNLEEDEKPAEPRSILTPETSSDKNVPRLQKISVSPPKHVHFEHPQSPTSPPTPAPAPVPPSTTSTKPVATTLKPRERKSRPLSQPQAQAYQVPEGVEIPNVGGQRSRKPTLASQWRKQKEKQKRQEQLLLDRLETFALWPSGEDEEKADVLAAQLAEAGFVFLGLNDSVQCSQCGLLLNGWSASDDPWMRHVEESPECSFLEATKGAQWVEDTLNSIK